jgi:hypothetical protein
MADIYSPNIHDEVKEPWREENNALLFSQPMNCYFGSSRESLTKFPASESCFHSLQVSQTEV